MGSTSEAWRCDACTAPLPPESAYAPMESLEVLCRSCLEGRLEPCDECGSLIRAAAYQHLPTGRVICESCVIKSISANRN